MAKRVHVGGRRAGVSTGPGPFAVAQSVASGAQPRRTQGQQARTTAAQSQLEHQIRSADVRLGWLMNLHREEFPAPVHESVPRPQLPKFSLLLMTAEKAELKGVGLFDRERRAEARGRARAQAEEWATDLMAKASAEHTARQAAVDTEWEGVRVGDPAAVSARLTAVFNGTGRPVRVMAAREAEVGLRVVLPSMELVPLSEPDVTALGNATLRKLTKTERCGWYRQLAASTVLLAAKESFTSAAGLATAHIVGVDEHGVPLLAARLSASSLFASDWRLGAWDILLAADPDARRSVGGRIGDLRAIDVRADSSFSDLVD